MRGPCTIIQAVSTHMSTKVSFGLLVCLLIFRLKKKSLENTKKSGSCLAVVGYA